MNKIDISSEEKKKKIYDIFNSLNSKNQIHEYFKISDNKNGSEYVKKIAYEIGFDLNVYKERKKKYCLKCGKQLKSGQKKFCSSSCSASYNNLQRGSLKESTKIKISNKLKEKYSCQNEMTIKTCLECGKQLTKKQQKFCSVKCANHNKKKKYFRHYEELICLNCGKEFKGLNGRKYCSLKCHNESIKKKIIKSFLDGSYTLNGNNAIPKTIREYLYERQNYKCELCNFEGYNLKTGNTILQIHHIDGDSNNNSLDNLQVICPNCHAKTENYMALNKGYSGRDKRYKKRNDGNSTK